ncbi:hypothetical protein B0T18DRAFT_392741 [Schizothecium vesticola]|uniref:LYC1 C-terminal domain-containing protein n=1 Tax=Schizothecium vesticola TaxID=314040 RepID=A0AA40ERF9_9PEZI|nr:hypothetical protein B0T18DRAFT_392741 [Schizothecium vesticola]
MGSTTPPPPSSFPDKTSPSLVLAHPTDHERRLTWSLTHAQWGPALTHDGYVRREAYMTTVPLAKDGGITHWILTDGSLPPDARPIYSSCETLRKRAVRTTTGTAGDLVDGIAHGVGSVFTDPRFRGRGYAGRMMREVGERLRGWQAGGEKEVLCSVLYSDIGKAFYARSGWAAFASRHVAFRPAAGWVAGRNGCEDGGARTIGYHELAELCSVDEKLLRREMAERGRQGRTCVALVPDLDQLLWHLMREDYMTKHIFGRTPPVKGAVFGEPGRRVWAVWTRGYYGGLESREGNTLHVLRVVMEDEGQPDEYLARGFREIVRIAQAEATEWLSQDLQLWNPSPKLATAIKESGLDCEFVDRDTESIASLMLYGESETTDVDWVANEKYGWC